MFLIIQRFENATMAGSICAHQEGEVFLDGEGSDEQVFLNDVAADRGHRLRSHLDAVRVSRAAVELQHDSDEVML